MSRSATTAPLDPAAAAPDGLPVLSLGAHRDARAGSCVMEYVSVLAGERFSDRPCCTHPAVAALAWQVNDAATHDVRQELVLRAPALIGAGVDAGTEVRPIVLAAIVRAGLALDPDHRFFRRLERRLARLAHDTRPSAAPPGASGSPGDRRPGRLATLLHVGPVNHACAHLMVAARAVGLDDAGRSRLAVALLDDCLAAVRALPADTSPGAGVTAPALLR